MRGISSKCVIQIVKLFCLCSHNLFCAGLELCVYLSLLLPYRWTRQLRSGLQFMHQWLMLCTYSQYQVKLVVFHQWSDEAFRAAERRKRIWCGRWGKQRSEGRDIKKDLIAYLQVLLLKLSNTETPLWLLSYQKLRKKKPSGQNCNYLKEFQTVTRKLSTLKFSVFVLGGKNGVEIQ